MVASSAMKSIADDGKLHISILEYNTGVHFERWYCYRHYVALLCKGKRFAVRNNPSFGDALWDAHFQCHGRNGWKIFDYFAVSALQRGAIEKMRHIPIIPVLAQ